MTRWSRQPFAPVAGSRFWTCRGRAATSVRRQPCPTVGSWTRAARNPTRCTMTCACSTLLRAMPWALRGTFDRAGRLLPAHHPRRRHHDGWTLRRWLDHDHLRGCRPEDPAIDEVAGSEPISDLSDCVGDYEQCNARLFSQVGPEQLYALAAIGTGRSFVQVLNFNDPCCFAGITGEILRPGRSRVRRRVGRWELPDDL